MSKTFVNDFDSAHLTKTFSEEENRFLLENNRKQLMALLNFYTGNSRLMLVNGFVGSGKSQVVEHSKHFLSDDVVVLDYNCFETTILDDILLSFFYDFHELFVNGQITQVKNKTDNFMQKIVSYFNASERPVLIVLNSFENILSPNRKEIFDFLFHLLKRDNVKLVIITRKCNFEEYISGTDYEKTTVLAFDKSLFEKCLKAEGIRNIGPLSDELYRYTKGYFLYTMLSITIIKARNLSLLNFIEGYTKSFLSFPDFIFREILSFVDPVSGHLFRLLTILRHPINTKLLQEMGLYDESRVDFFVKNYLLSQSQNTLYLQDYYREISQNSIPDNVLVKLHRACSALYESQLPLKPLERDIMISRRTMHDEISYHNSFLPQKPKPVIPIDPPAEQDKPSQVEQPEAPQSPTREEVLKNISFVFQNEEEEEKILGEIADSINGFIDYSNKVLSPEESQLPFMELINRANLEEKRFNRQKAIAFYQAALTRKEDMHFPQMVSRIYPQIAKCFESISDWYNAAKYYETALAYYQNAHDSEKMNEIKLALANVFFITYKHDRAKLLLEEVADCKENIKRTLKIQALINLAELEDANSERQKEFYEKALSLVDSSCDKSVLAKLYYTAGELYDEGGSPENAIIYYKKCSDIQSDNIYLAPALGGIAEILEDAGLADKALHYYSEALRVDERDENLNGIYLTASKLASLLKHDSPSEASAYYLMAISLANKMNSPYCKMMSEVKYGDFCHMTKQYPQAFAHYSTAFDVAKHDRKCEKYIKKIEQRINVIRQQHNAT